MPNDFNQNFKDIFKTNYFSDKDIIDGIFHHGTYKKVGIRIKRHPYYIKKLKEKEFKQQLNKL